MEDLLILVNQEDHVVGFGPKLEVHQRGVLHRAFSTFIFDSRGRLLLQQRARGKYHSGGLWTNTCCGHPRPGEPNEAAARRRLVEEMGFECALQRVSTLIYRARVSDALIEHEYDHIHAGVFDGDPMPDPGEAADWTWIEIPELLIRVEAAPDTFTIWFKCILTQAGLAGLRAWQERVSARRANTRV